MTREEKLHYFLLGWDAAEDFHNELLMDESESLPEAESGSVWAQRDARIAKFDAWTS